MSMKIMLIAFQLSFTHTNSHSPHRILPRTHCVHLASDLASLVHRIRSTGGIGNGAYNSNGKSVLFVVFMFHHDRREKLRTKSETERTKEMVCVAQSGKFERSK